MGPCAQDLNSYWQMGEIENNWSKQQESGAVCKSVIVWASPWARGGITGSWTLTTLDADTWRKWLWILHSGFIQHQWAELSLCIQGNWSFRIESHASYSWNSLRTPKKRDRTKVLTIHFCTLLTQFYTFTAVISQAVVLCSMHLLLYVSTSTRLRQALPLKM